MKHYLLSTQLIKLLKDIFNDSHQDSWIEYFIEELNFGAKNVELKVRDKNGNNIPLSNASELYDFLINGKCKSPSAYELDTEFILRRFL